LTIRCCQGFDDINNPVLQLGVKRLRYHQSMSTPTHFSRIIAGCWRMASWQQSTQQRLGWIQACMDLGITSFDHADVYGDYEVQSLFGQALALKPSLRQNMQLISKAGICSLSAKFAHRSVKHYDSSGEHLIASTEQSLRDLGTDHLDVLLIHRPDPLSDWDEIARAFELLRSSGKVLAFGVSNFTTAQFAALHSRIPLITNQIELSALHTHALHDGTLLQAQQLKARPMIWSPLAGGKLFEPNDIQAARVHSEMQSLASSFNVSVATIAYAWVMRHPSQPHVITGTQRLEGLQEAVRATGLALTREQWTAIWQASLGHPIA
jgi:predicted oxidoreductase